MHNIAITTECVADLPMKILEAEEIDIIYYDIETDGGVFRDTDELDAENVVEYIGREGKSIKSIVPSANDYKSFFRKKLDEYDEVVHISISSKVSQSFEHANLAKVKLGIDGRRIKLIDSNNLSSGIGLLVLEAVACRNKGMTSKEIVARVNEKIDLVSTSFLANNADYLYYNGKVSLFVKKLCNRFRLHPVMKMKGGMLVVDRFYIGRYENAMKKYVSRVFKNSPKALNDVGFLTYVGCNHDFREEIRAEIRKFTDFKKLYSQSASATISSNSGPLTFGIIFFNAEA